MFAKTTLNPLKGTFRVGVFSLLCVSQRGLTKKFRHFERSEKSNMFRRAYGWGLDFSRCSK
jgi:hypothetical protein